MTRACKPMTRSDSTILVTRLDQVMTRLDKISDHSDSKGSDPTKMTRAHHCSSRVIRLKTWVE